MDQKKLLDIVNGSGFPLQIAVEAVVRDKQEGRSWRIAHREHSWKNPLTTEEGFIDLVLVSADDTVVLIVECKRVLNTTWTFVVTENADLQRRHAKLGVSTFRSPNKLSYVHKDRQVNPTSAESDICIVFGEGSGRERPMLERLAATVASSMDAFADEEVKLVGAQRRAERLYVSVIVTTAELKVCKVDRGSIDLKEGKVPAGEFYDANVVRFRKQLNHKKLDYKRYEEGEFSYGAISLAKENTVFIVNSLGLETFLDWFSLAD